MSNLDILVILGTVRQQRQGIKAADFIVGECRSRGHETTLVDPLVDAFPMLDKMYKEFGPGEAPAVMEKVAGLIRKADAIIVVSAEYNHSIPPALSNTLDHYLEEYFWRPSAIVCYSPSPVGGLRAAMQLRAMLGELGMSSIPSIFSIGKIGDAFDDQGAPKDPKMRDQSVKFLDELEWYASALKRARERGLPK